MASIVLDGTTSISAMPCPENAICTGGLAAPAPQKGYWYELSCRDFLAV
jgi:hypothetical protein